MLGCWWYRKVVLLALSQSQYMGKLIRVVWEGLETTSSHRWEVPRQWISASCKEEHPNESSSPVKKDSESALPEVFQKDLEN